MWLFYPEATVLKYSFLLLKNLQGEWPPATDPWLTVLVWDYKTLIACLAPDHENTPVLPGHWIQSCVRPGALWVTNHNEKASLPSLTDVHSMFGIFIFAVNLKSKKRLKVQKFEQRVRCFLLLALFCGRFIPPLGEPEWHRTEASQLVETS